MGIVKRSIRRVFEWAINEPNLNSSSYDMGLKETVPRSMLNQSSVPVAGAGRPDFPNAMNFTVYRANGGTVVYCNQYEPIKDRNTSSLYVIPDGQNLGEEISQIITIEKLSR